MTLAELRTKYERLAHDIVPGTMLPAVETYRQFLKELDLLKLNYQSQQKHYHLHLFLKRLYL